VAGAVLPAVGGVEGEGMNKLNQAVYDLLMAWGVDGEHTLTYVADRALEDSSVPGMLQSLDQQIEFARANLLAMEALRRAIESRDTAALAAMHDKDMHTLEDWKP
jgi:hypothetical protein